MKELKKKLTQLEIEFSKNLSEEKSMFEFSEEELSKAEYCAVYLHEILCCFYKLVCLKILSKLWIDQKLENAL